MIALFVSIRNLSYYSNHADTRVFASSAVDDCEDRFRQRTDRVEKKYEIRSQMTRSSTLGDRNARHTGVIVQVEQAANASHPVPLTSETPGCKTWTICILLMLAGSSLGVWAAMQGLR